MSSLGAFCIFEASVLNRVDPDQVACPEFDYLYASEHKSIFKRNIGVEWYWLVRIHRSNNNIYN